MATQDVTATPQTCRVDGCAKTAMYKSDRLCQMHYHRIRKHGDTELHRKQARSRYECDRGYQYIYAPNHPLTPEGQFYLAEHRKVLYEAIGPGTMSCEICGASLTWRTCQADHIDENPRNNKRENLRPLCRRCNVWRSMPPAAQRIKGALALTFQGETKTANEWARDPRVCVSRGTIKRRKQAGMTDEAALFGEKVTHNGRAPKPPKRKTQFKHERKNSIAITVGERTMTAAEWAKEPGVTVSGAGIIYRVRSGWSHEKAVFQKGRFA